MKTLLSLFLAVAALCLCAAHGEDVCSSYTSCESCLNSTKCLWALLYNCTERCISLSYRDPNDIDARRYIFRNFAVSQDQCNYLDSCQIAGDGTENPSFEFQLESRDYYGSEVRRKSGEISKKYNSYDVAMDGDYFLFMGGSPEDYRTRVYGVSASHTISKKATHLMFFYALPYYSQNFGMPAVDFINRTALDVLIDDELLVRLSNLNIDKTIRLHDRFYWPMEVGIEKFADGNMHTISLHFTEAKNEDDYDGKSPIHKGTRGQVIIVDYLQLITKKCKQHSPKA